MPRPRQRRLEFTSGNRPSEVISIGYERRTVEDLVRVLVENRVKHLLDIREAPVSRRPGFSKDALARVLERAGIQYEHLEAAGNPFRDQKQNVARCLQLYRAHLQRHPNVVRLAVSKVNGARVAFLCYERDHDSCHRSVLLAAMLKTGCEMEVIREE